MQAVCGLITTDADYAHKVAQALREQAQKTPRSEIALRSIEDNAFCVITDAQTMIELANEYATEHLEIACANPEEYIDKIHNAGSIFVGAYTPEAVGDYIAGPNHVLPTAGSARFFSPLGVDTFMKRSAWTQWTREGLAAHREAIETLAECEELVAHADSVRIRFSDL